MVMEEKFVVAVMANVSLHDNPIFLGKQAGRPAMKAFGLLLALMWGGGYVFIIFMPN